MKTILIPIDFSDSARNALAYAVNLFRDESCEFILLHCTHERTHFWNPEDSRRDFQKPVKPSAKAGMNRLVQELRQAYPNQLHRFSTSVEEARLLPAVKRHISTCELSCIVIGSHGITYNRDVFYGSNAKALIEGVKNCPLVVIPSNVKYTRIREIVLPSDFHFKPKPEELKLLKDLMKITGASLHVLHIQATDRMSWAEERNRELLKDLLEEEPEWHYLTKISIAEGIYSFTEERASDLLIFINKKKSFLDNLLLENRKDFSCNYFKMPLIFIHYEPAPKEI